MVKKLLAASPKRSPNRSVSLLEADGETLTNTKDIANTLENYFSTIGEKLAIKSILSYTYFVKNRIFSFVFLNPSSVAEVYTELYSINLKKSTGPHNITSYFVKLAAPIFSLLNIFP